MNQETVIDEHGEPSGLSVGLALSLASVVFGAFIFIIELLVGAEVPGASTLSTLVPALSVGYLYGRRAGRLMKSETRWKAIAVWTAVSAVFLWFLLALEGQSLMELMGRLGWFNLLMFVFFIVAIVVSYLMLKSGEKMAINQIQKKRGSSG